jgi:hypothetical protein
MVEWDFGPRTDPLIIQSVPEMRNPRNDRSALGLGLKIMKVMFNQIDVDYMPVPRICRLAVEDLYLPCYILVAT